MARYGTFRYGAQKYGMVLWPYLLWALEVDWDGDGLFDGRNDAVDLVDLSIKRGRRHYLKSDGSGFEQVDVGEAIITLSNTSRRYDPWNVNSDLYLKILPGRRVRLRVRIPDGSVWTLFAGRLSDIQPTSGDEPRMQIRAVDGMQWLRDQSSTSIVLQQSISYATAIGSILTAAAWPWEQRLDADLAELNWWWTQGKSADSEIAGLANASLGTFFVASDGAAVFYSHNHTSGSVLAIDESQLYRELTLPQPWEVVRNIIDVQVHALQQQATGNLWQNYDKPFVPNGGSVEIWAKFGYNGADVAAANVIAPVVNTDYTANTAEDGSGTDLSASFQITTTVFAMTAKLAIENNSGLDGYIILLKIRGDALAPGDSTIEAQDTVSQANYGPRALTLDSAWLQNTNTANDFSRFLKSALSGPQVFPQVRLEGRPDLQFVPDLFDRISLGIPSKGIDADFKIGQIEHKWLEPSGQSVITTWGLEPYADLAGNYWQFPTLIGQTSIFAF